MNIAEAVAVIEAHPDYRLLRRFVPQYTYDSTTSAKLRRGLYIDTETDGTDTNTANILELALVPFLYEPAQRHVVSIIKEDCVAFLNDPGKPLDETIRRLTGITDQDLAGQKLDYDAIVGQVVKADLIVAHNAGFDRKIVERYIPAFRGVPWACSQQDVPWRTAFAAPAERLEILARFLCNIFYGAHRAMADCLVGVHLLATATDGEGNSAFHYLLESARQETIRIWACGSPFHTKDTLRNRGYRWNDGTDGRPKAWHKSISHNELQEENQWLRTNVGAYPEVTSTEAIDRYSVRDR